MSVESSDGVVFVPALTGLGAVDRMLGRYEPAGERYERALRIAEATGDHLDELVVLTGLGSVHRILGRFEQAGEHHERALRLAQVIGDRTSERIALASR